MTSRAVFLDRDGVLIEAIVRDNKPYAVASFDEVRLIDGAAEACAELKRLGFLLILITNQPEIARGTITREFVEEVNRRVAARLGLDGVRLCPHDNADGCGCRKPKPGLMTDAARELSINLLSSFVVGDRWCDVEAGRRAGCRTVFIDRGYDEAMTAAPDHRAPSLLAALPWIKSQA